MIKSILSKLRWLGRGTVWLAKGTSILVGLTVMVALTAGVVSTATAANNGNFILGVLNNSATAITKLTANIANPALHIVNTSTGTNATALKLETATTKAPMTVNSGTKVANLNADKVDSIDGGAVAQPIAYGTEHVFGSPLTTGDNFVLGASFTPKKSGKCVVTASTQIQESTTSANTSTGPWYRIASKKGANAPTNDNQYGHYFQPFMAPSGAYGDMTRSSVIPVTAGEPVQFGAYFGSPSSDWVGDSPHVLVTYSCTTPGAGTVGTS